MPRGGPTRPAYSPDERASVLATLARNDGNISATARETGVSALTLRRWREMIPTTSQPFAITTMADEAPAMRERLVRELANLGFSRITDVVSWDSTGKLTWIASEALSDAARAGIESIKVRETLGPMGQVVSRDFEVKRRPPEGALRMLAQIYGFLAPANVQVLDQSQHLNVALPPDLTLAELRQLASLAESSEMR